MKEKGERIKLGFLGQEFIFWLFKKSSDDTYFPLEEYGTESVELFLEEQITLDSIRGDGYTETIKSKELSELEDVKSSMKSGRIPSSVKVRIIRGELEWAFQIKSNPLMIKAVKLPIVADSAKDDIKQMRLVLIEHLDKIIQALFAMFLVERETINLAKDFRKFLGINE